MKLLYSASHIQMFQLSSPSPCLSFNLWFNNKIPKRKTHTKCVSYIPHERHHWSYTTERSDNHKSTTTRFLLKLPSILNYISMFFTCQVQKVWTSQADNSWTDEWMMQERGGEGEGRRWRYMAGDTERGGGWSGLGSLNHQRRLNLKSVRTATRVHNKLTRPSCNLLL